MNHDHLTGLTSRQEAMRYFRENADSLIGSTMVLIDHDSFKEINGTYGHDEGDHVIKEQAKRLKNSRGMASILHDMAEMSFSSIFGIMQPLLLMKIFIICIMN